MGISGGKIPANFIIGKIICQKVCNLIYLAVFALSKY
jgi:hypothetical protein